MGDVALHLRGGTIVPMQQQPAMVTRDVRLSPVTLVVALPSAASARDTSLHPYALEETCGAARQTHSDKLVSCGYMFMDSGDDITVTAQNSVQVSDQPPRNRVCHMGFVCQTSHIMPGLHVGYAALSFSVCPNNQHMLLLLLRCCWWLQAWFTAVSSPDALSGTISTTVLAAGAASSNLHIESVHILGAANALDMQCVLMRVNDESTGHVEATPGVIKLSGLHLPVGERFEITWQAAPVAAR
jgi:hypothetical protein